MSLSFGNMTLELNVFNIVKQPGEDDETFEVNHISSIVKNCFEEMLDVYSTTPFFNQKLNPKLNEGCEEENENEEGEFEKGVHFAEKWTPTFEELSPDLRCSVPPVKKIHMLELKPLPADLKYVFLGGFKSCPVIISSHVKE